MKQSSDKKTLNLEIVIDNENSEEEDSDSIK
jgi:hypothetical protein